MTLWLATIASCACLVTAADDTPVFVVEPSIVHVRSGDQREWDWFPESADETSLRRTFTATRNDAPCTLTVRQQDVKQGWEVRLNDQRLGNLVRDENDMEVDFLVPPGGLQEGQNHLEILQQGVESDDIRIGPVEIAFVSIDQRRADAGLEVLLIDSKGDPLPGRITIMNDQGTLIPCAVDPRDGLAVRQGVVYTIDGTAKLRLAAGRYRVVATRGIEYSLGERFLSVVAGQSDRVVLTLHRVVDTSGWVACDTHVHTLTHSGHGDCSIEERMVTLAGEGIELPIATDHNKAIDYRPQAQTVGADSFFTPVIGDECTTKKGHFNVFPIQVDDRLPNHLQEDWGQLMADVQSTAQTRVAILNHARDLHSGFRPFSPAHHISLTGQRVDDRPLDFNAMEILNSGAVQTDGMQLFHDWCGLINRGLAITPIGSSDSHDVARFIVGQGRTYIRCDDSDPASIDVDDAVAALLQGRVVVSYGLFLRLSIDEQAEPGDVMTIPQDQTKLVVSAEVHGPAWTQAESIALYMGGREAYRYAIDPVSEPGSSLKTRVSWEIPRAQIQHDTWFTAVAVGPGIDQSYWKTALPYQPTSSSFAPYVFSSTGPIRIDSDGDGKSSSAYALAQALMARFGTDRSGLINELNHYDANVVHQVAALVQVADEDLSQFKSLASVKVALAVSEYQRAHRSSVVAKMEAVE